ncbi:MAG: hypothetical protein S4CHLAM123_03460 [Chlamydiales bacterium]|nr:hypothetical protein [Chlamydiales bacterium]
MLLKKLCVVSVLFSMLLSIKVTGNEYNSCCCQGVYDSEWTLYADYLYWRARRCNLDFALQNGDATLPIGRDVYSVDPEYNSGYRVGVVRQCDCLYFDIAYTHFHDSETNSLIADSVAQVDRFLPTRSFDNPESATFAKGVWDFDYDIVDAVVGYGLSNCGCLETYVFGGLKLAFIDQRLYTTYNAEIVTDTFELYSVKQTYDLDAYGVDLGIGANYTLCGCFNFYGRFSYDVLLGNLDRKFIQNPEVIASVDVVDLRDTCWAALNVANLAFGIGYDYKFCGCCVNSLSISIGYEFHKWINLPDFYQFNTDYSVENSSQGFGLDGLVIHFALGF